MRGLNIKIIPDQLNKLPLTLKESHIRAGLRLIDFFFQREY